MNKTFLLSILSTVIITSFGYATPNNVTINSNDNHTRISTKGNLMVTNALGCISLKEAKNTYTPADLFPASAECIKENQPKKAAELFFLASAYSCYDTKRITDRTAYGATSMLIYKNVTSLPDSHAKKNWNKAIKDIMKDNRAECKAVSKIGIPNYVPIYMATHGMKAFRTHYKNLINTQIDKKAGWNQCMSEHLKCGNIN